MGWGGARGPALDWSRAGGRRHPHGVTYGDDVTPGDGQVLSSLLRQHDPVRGSARTAGPPDRVDGTFSPFIGLSRSTRWRQHTTSGPGDQTCGTEN
jgi:hypothetical protein